MLATDNSLLLMIDVQDKLTRMLKNPDEIVKNNLILLKTANALGVNTIVTEQYPQGLGNTVSELKEYIKEQQIFEKKSFSVIDNNEIIENIKNIDPKNIIISGIETHICVYQTALALLDKGYNVYIVKNATASRNKKDYRTALELMRDFGAKLTCVETVLFELLKTSEHPKFKEIQALIK